MDVSVYAYIYIHICIYREKEGLTGCYVSGSCNIDVASRPLDQALPRIRPGPCTFIWWLCIFANPYIDTYKCMNTNTYTHIVI